MKTLFSIVIFCLVLFFYLHIQFQFKKSDDLEIYQLDNTATKDKLEDLCDIRQPIIFDFENQTIMETTNKSYIQKNYPSFEVKIRNSLDFYTLDEKEKEKQELYVPLQVGMSQKLLEEDKNSTYYSENNMDFLRETGINKSLQENDSFIRPYMTSSCHYDVLMGSEGTVTPLRYDLNYRNYFIVTQGSIQVKLTPPKNMKYLYPNYDYENFEWTSPLNLWNIQPDFKGDFDKIKSLEFTMIPKTTLYIPAYWWYTIKFNKDASVTCLKYRTFMNDLAISPYFFIYGLQHMNIKRETTKKLNIDLLNKGFSEKKEDVEEAQGEKEDTTKIEELPKEIEGS